MTKIIKTDTYVQDKATGLGELSATPTEITNVGQLYTKENAGITELYFQRDTPTEIQITSGSGLNVPPVDVTKLVNSPVEAYLTTDPILDAIPTKNYVLQFSDTTAPPTVLANLSANNAQSLSFADSTVSSMLALESVCIGYGARVGNTAACEKEVVIGANACGNQNIAGEHAGNVFIGAESGYSRTEVFNCVGIGHRSLYTGGTASGNTGVGVLSGAAITGSYNSLFGYRTGASISSGENNTILGYNAGNNLTTDSSSNVIIGSGAAETSATAVDNMVAIGFEAAKVNTADGTVAIGYQAGDANTSGAGNTYLGCQAGSAISTSAGGTYVGYQAGLAATGANNTIIGYQAGDSVSSGARNTIMGAQAGAAITNSSDNVFIGYNAGATANAGPQICIGYEAGNAAATASGKIAIGYEAGKGAGGANSVFIGYKAGTVATGGDNVFIGTSAGLNATNGTGCVCVGRDAGKLLTTNVNNVVLIGQEAGDAINNATASGSVAIGYQAASLLASAAGGTYVGYRAGYQTTGANNTVVGYEAAYSASLTGTDNVAVGYRSLYNAGTAANYNTVIGSTAGDAITGGDNNTLIGYGAGGAITTGSGNCALGLNALGNNSGSYNIAIGDGTLAGGGSGGYNIAIGSNAIYNGIITGTCNIAIGREAGYALTSANSSVFIGDSTGKQATTSSDSVCIGHNAAGGVLTANGLVAIGYQAGYLVTSGSGNTIVGYEAGDAITTSTNNTILGYQAGSAINTTANGNNSTLIGYQAGLTATGNNNILIGSSAGSSITTGDYNIIIGANAGAADAQRTFKIGYDALNEPIFSGVMYDGVSSSGGTDSELQTNVQLFKIRDPENNLEQFRAKDGKLSTYGEDVPDIDVGGICQKMISGSTKAYSIKLTGLSHGLTSVFSSDGDDTFYKIKHSSYASPEVYAISTQTSTEQGTTPALKFIGFARTTSTLDEAGGWLTGVRSVFEFDAEKHDGSNGTSAFSDTDSIFSVLNYRTPKFAIAGNGNVYANAYLDVLDVEDDIKLVQSFSAPQANPYYDRLKEIGVITDCGMMCLNKAHMLSIGAIGQLFNVIRGLAKKLGVSEDELYELAKQY